MSQKFYKLVDKKAVECKARGEFTEWLSGFDIGQGIVEVTEIAGMVILTAFRPMVDENKHLDADHRICPFHTRLFLGWADEFNPEMPIPFPANPQTNRAPREYQTPSWRDAEMVHRVLVQRMNRLYVESGLKSADILKRVALTSKANNRDQ